MTPPRLAARTPDTAAPDRRTRSTDCTLAHTPSVDSVARVRWIPEHSSPVPEEYSAGSLQPARADASPALLRAHPEAGCSRRYPDRWSTVCCDPVQPALAGKPST